MPLHKCPKCSYLIVDQIEECPFCGERFVEPEVDQQQQKMSKTIYYMALVPILLIFLTIIVVLLKSCSG